MANVGSGASGKTFIGAGNGASGTFASIGTNSGLTAHGLVVSQGNGAFTATASGSFGQVLLSNGASADPSFGVAPASSLTTVFDSSGTWIKNSRTKSVQLYIWAGGGGGGSGRKGTSASAGGGGGGSAGQFYAMLIPGSCFGAQETVVVGGGGAGGGSQTSDAQNGSIGIDGTLSSFGLISTLPGVHGNGGTTTTGSPGGAKTIIGQYMVSVGGIGGQGAVSTGSTPPPNTGSAGSGCGSGGGGGAGANSVTERQGGSGGLWTNIASTTVSAGGAGGLESTGINGNQGNPMTTSGGFMVGGTGGGGGGGYSVGALGATTGGRGGDGGIPGGGGGGGGGGIDTVAASGAGGNGGNGRVIVIEYF